nr:PREDICTED: transmembrane protease serine 6-like isoform X1 [Latimeria chalumnae]|eukprot:XP_014350583.1 PREDICTED: transmembrane protease serine 6-like isoform X1 [Latimeria chalumnae]
MTIHDCYRYSSVQPGKPKRVQGLHSFEKTCLWNLLAPQGHMIKLQVTWLLEECEGLLIVYDSLLPVTNQFITSQSACRRQEPVLEVLSSGRFMSVMWKKGFYNYSEPFALLVKALPDEACPGKFYCFASDSCVLPCNGVQDCSDGSDEKLCDCGKYSSSLQITSGSKVMEGELPWQVSLQVHGVHVCSGTLISDSWVVSAAHCFFGERLSSPIVWIAYLGKFQLTKKSEHEVSFLLRRIIRHELYNPKSQDYNIALVQLDRAVPNSTFIRPICVPTASHVFFMGLNCWITGWGTVRSGPRMNNLQKAKVQVIHKDVCLRTYDHTVTPRMLCTKYELAGISICQGNSGGPLMCEEPSGRWMLVAVASWNDCSTFGHYSIYTRVSRLVGWIQEVIAFYKEMEKVFL